MRGLVGACVGGFDLVGDAARDGLDEEGDGGVFDIYYTGISDASSPLLSTRFQKKGRRWIKGARKRETYS